MYKTQYNMHISHSGGSCRESFCLMKRNKVLNID